MPWSGQWRLGTLALAVSISFPHCLPVVPAPLVVMKVYWALGDLSKVLLGFSFLGNRDSVPSLPSSEGCCEDKMAYLRMRNNYFPIKRKMVRREKAVGWEPGHLDLSPDFL